MGPGDLLALVVGVLEGERIEYLVTGSMASISYGEPRFTNDIDIVVRVAPEAATRLAAVFAGDAQFYVSPDAAREAALSGGQFNVLHPGSGYKIDFMVAADDAFNASRFARARRVPFGHGQSALFASPEDVILRKLEYYREGGSEKHLRDIRGILRIAGEQIDADYMDDWAERLGVAERWRQVRLS